MTSTRSGQSHDVGVGVIGYGYWGPNLVRNFAEEPRTSVIGIADLRSERRALAAGRHPSVKITNAYRDLLRDPRVNAIAIASPVATHFDLALEALQAGKHVFVEKPLAATSAEALRLIEEADQRQLVILVDHTFVYTPAVAKIRELLSNGVLGQPYYYDSMRVNLGLFQHDVNVLWDLGVHDLSIIDYLLEKSPLAVSATGMSHVDGQPANVAYLSLFFEENFVAHINTNWLAPVKVRRVLLGGSQRMIVYDELEPSEKIKIYDKGIILTQQQTEEPTEQQTEQIYRIMVGYRTGDMWAPKLDITEALQRETQHFADCICRGERPITGPIAAYRVIRTLEAATESLGQRGQLIELDRARVLV